MKDKLVIYKIRIPETETYKEKITKCENIFRFLHRNANKEKYAILLPELKKRNYDIKQKPDIGNIFNIYLPKNSSLEEKLKKFLFINSYPSITFDIDTYETNKFAYTIKRNNLKKRTFSYIKNFINKINNIDYNKLEKLLVNEINKKIYELYKKGLSPEDIYIILRKPHYKNKYEIYPYIIYDSITLWKKGILNNTIFEFDTIFIDNPEIKIKTTQDLKYFNNFGLLNQKYKKLNIGLPV